MGNRKGFTLAELLVVVAILAILVAVSIPIFSGKLDEAKAATCAANCRNLKAELSAEYLQSGTLNGSPPATGPITLTTEQTKNYTCPSGGTISAKFDNNAIFLTVTCSKHGGSGSFGDSDTINSIKKVIDETKPGKVDSGAVNYGGSNSDTLVKALADSGLNLKDLGAVSWQYQPEKNESFLYWSPEDISSGSVKVGDKIPVYRYNFTTGTYTIWISTIETTTTTTNGTKSEAYKTFNNKIGGYAAYTPSTSESSDKQTFERAQELYNSYK